MLLQQKTNLKDLWRIITETSTLHFDNWQSVSESKLVSNHFGVFGEKLNNVAKPRPKAAQTAESKAVEAAESSDEAKMEAPPAILRRFSVVQVKNQASAIEERRAHFKAFQEANSKEFPETTEIPETTFGLPVRYTHNPSTT